MRNKAADGNPGTRVHPSSHMGVLAATSAYTYAIDKGVYVIPIRSLAP